MKILHPDIIPFLDSLSEGVHVVDINGTAKYYNPAMELIEGILPSEALGATLDEIYPDFNPENSTLMNVIKTGEPVISREQRYYNRSGRRIHTLNTTLPLFEDGALVGAIEIARDLRVISDLAEENSKLLARISKPPKKDPVLKKTYSFESLVGKSDVFLKAIDLAKRASRTDSSVLISGVTGTGKEIFAQSIHYEGHRSEKPFIAYNCAAIPEGLLESILFGTVKGAFTGAEDRAGLFEQAGGGTLFLDEINSMSPSLQAKLLRVLQESYLRRVGGNTEIPVDVRIIASSNQSAAELLESGSMRKDLFYRINVINIEIPKLVDRIGDIEYLARHFMAECSSQMQKDVWMISPKVLQIFQSYSWPGNVRELKNVIEASISNVEQGGSIERVHLPPHFEHRLKSKPIKKNQMSLDEILRQTERKILIEMYDGNVSATAKRLGMSRQKLQYRLKIHGISK